MVETAAWQGTISAPSNPRATLDKSSAVRQSYYFSERTVSTDKQAEKGSIGSRLAAEMRAYLGISLYLWICFGALMFYESAMLRAEHVKFLPLGTAAIKALVIGKFILIGKAMNVGEVVRHSLLLSRIAWKSLATLMLLLLFTAVEELVVGMVHGQAVADIAAEMLERSWMERLAPAVIMLLVLVPLIAFEQIDRALGKGSLMRMLLDRSDK